MSRLFIWLFLIVGLTRCEISPAFASDTIPPAAAKHHRELMRVAHHGMGLAAPIATLAAQVHQESRWNQNAKSGVGAQGLAQFMPATSQWIADITPALGKANPFNPTWALTAMIEFDNYLLAKTSAASPCENWAFTLAAYNGGLGWVNRDKKLASVSGADKRVYFDSVERANGGRSQANFAENRHYVRVILTRFEPLYANANWGNGVCKDRWVL